MCHINHNSSQHPRHTSFSSLIGFFPCPTIEFCLSFKTQLKTNLHSAYRNTIISIFFLRSLIHFSPLSSIVINLYFPHSWRMLSHPWHRVLLIWTACVTGCPAEMNCRVGWTLPLRKSSCALLNGVFYTVWTQ